MRSTVRRRARERWCALEELERRIVLAAVAWDGGGGDNLWTNPLNWDTDAVPGSGDDVTIAGTALAEIVLTGSQTVNSLDLQESLRVAPGSSLRVAGALDVSGSADLVVLGDVFWRSGTMDGSGALRVGSTGSVMINGTVQLEREIVNQGHLRWNSGDIVTSAQGVLRNLPTGVVTTTSAGGFLGAGSWRNVGTIIRGGAANQTTTIATDFSSVGTVIAWIGTLRLSGDVAEIVDGDLLAGAWRIFGTLDIPGAQILRNFATILISGGSADWPALARLAENDGQLTLAAGAAWNFDPLGGRFISRGDLRLFARDATSFIDHALTSTGTLDIRSGTVMLRGGGNAGGSIFVRSGTTLEVRDQRYILTGDNSLAGAGTLRFRTASGGLGHQIGGTGRHVIRRLEVLGAILSLQSDLIVGTMLIDFSGSGPRGVLTGPADLLVNRRLDWGRGTILGLGKVVLTHAATTHLITAYPIVLGRTLENHGQFNWSELITFADGVLVNGAAGEVTVSFRSNRLAPKPGYTGLIVNNCTLERAARSERSTLSIVMPFEQNGTFRVSLGEIVTFGDFVNAGRIELTGGGWRHAGATFTNLGTIDMQQRNLNGGRPFMFIDRIFIQSDVATLRIDLSSAWGSFRAGTARLDGTLEVWVSRDFSDLRDGARLTLLFASRSIEGRFATEVLPDLPRDLKGAISYETDRVVFVVSS